jgi:hypothetical protein
MAKKRSPTVIAAMRRSNKNLRLNHVELLDDDFDWLAGTERLRLWNVKLPTGLLSRMEKLWWLHIRGGSATNLEILRGVNQVKYLAVNQVRGMCDLSVISELTNLRYLDLYGLPKVTQLPSCAALTDLEHAKLGQMRGLVSLHGLLEAPRLRELQLVRKINVNDVDVEKIKNHATIKQFGWFAEGVPVEVWRPVVERIALPPVPHGYPEDWFGIDRG